MLHRSASGAWEEFGFFGRQQNQIVFFFFKQCQIWGLMPVNPNFRRPRQDCRELGAEWLPGLQSDSRLGDKQMQGTPVKGQQAPNVSPWASRVFICKWQALMDSRQSHGPRNDLLLFDRKWLVLLSFLKQSWCLFSMPGVSMPGTLFIICPGKNLQYTWERGISKPCWS